VHEGDSRVSQSRNGIVSVSWVLGLVGSGTPIEVENEIRLRSNHSTR